jgi:hypothetical protein
VSRDRKLSSAGAALGLVLAGLSGVLTSVGHETTSSAQPIVHASAPAPSASHANALFLPDPVLHPGKRSTMTKAQLCDPSFRTAHVRPSTSYTNKLKALMLGDGGTVKAPSGTTYRVTGEHLPGALADYELDHLINLAIGGNPEDPKNLWMEPWERKGRKLASVGYGAETKDVLENRLRRELCRGGIGIQKAQAEIARNWMSAKALP